jgi:thioredoxin
MIFVYIIAGIILLFVGLQLSIVLSAKRTKGKKILGLPSRLKPLEKNGSSGIVYFFSPSCRACTMQTPIIKSLQNKYKNIFDVDISKEMQIARLFGIKATPTTVAVKDGTIEQVFIGVKQKDFFEDYLKGKN